MAFRAIKSAALGSLEADKTRTLPHTKLKEAIMGAALIMQPHMRHRFYATRPLTAWKDVLNWQQARLASSANIKVCLMRQSIVLFNFSVRSEALEAGQGTAEAIVGSSTKGSIAEDQHLLHSRPLWKAQGSKLAAGWKDSNGLEQQRPFLEFCVVFRNPPKFVRRLVVFRPSVGWSVGLLCVLGP